jgi:hypothetical protein
VIIEISTFSLERKVRAVVSKRGVDDGNQKGGGFPQPAQESHYHYKPIRSKSKDFLYFLFI